MHANAKVNGLTLFPLPAEIDGMQDRSDYKSTWEALAPNEQQARMFVAGHTDDAEWDRSAGITHGILEEFVEIRPDDVILEIGCGIGRVGKVLSPLCARWIGADISSGMLDLCPGLSEGSAEY